VIDRGVSTADRVRLVMEMLMRMRAANGRFVRILPANVKDLGLLVVDLDDRVIGIRHGSSSAIAAILLHP
jgi:hypothetical protein